MFDVQTCANTSVQNRIVMINNLSMDILASLSDCFMYTSSSVCDLAHLCFTVSLVQLYDPTQLFPAGGKWVIIPGASTLLSLSIVSSSLRTKMDWILDYCKNRNLCHSISVIYWTERPNMSLVSSCQMWQFSAALVNCLQTVCVLDSHL